MKYIQNAITTKIELALEDSDISLSDFAHDIAIYMMNWLENMSDLNKSYISPETYNSKQTTDLLMKFLLHWPSHLAAAHNLLTNEP